MFSAYFLTCMLSASGNVGCNVAYTELAEVVQEQSQCDELVLQMHQFVLDQIAIEYPSMQVYRTEHGCYAGPLSAGEIARDEHAKLLEAGIDASLTEVP